MPRGIKGSGKQGKNEGKTIKKAMPVQPTAVQPTAALATTMPTKASRKPYPSIDERITMSNAAIARLMALSESRQKLIVKAEEALAERRDALVRIEADLEKAKAKREKLLLQKNKKSETSASDSHKLSAEERKAARLAAMSAAREAKKANKAKMAQLMEKLDQSGLTLDEVIEKLGN